MSYFSMPQIEPATPTIEMPPLWEVAVALPLPHPLTYRLPAALVDTARVGSLVRVPVGRDFTTLTWRLEGRKRLSYVPNASPK